MTYTIILCFFVLTNWDQVCDGSAYDKRKQNLMEIPGDIPPTTRELNLNGNQISAVVYGQLNHLTQLTTLRLSNNKISILEADALNGSSSLQSVYLSENELTYITKEMFEDLVHLRTLDLNRNQIIRVNSTTFGLMPELTSLNLDYNDISEMDIDTFYNMPELRSLYLAGNELTYIANGTFDRSLKLAHLYLYSNKIEHIETGVLNGIPELTYLNLQSNRFTTIYIGNLSNLEQLLISNKLTEPPKLHHILPSLTSLFLSSNKITYVEPEYFLSTPILRTLSLSGNVLTLFDAYYLVKIEFLRLDSNRFTSFPNITNCRLTLREFSMRYINNDLNNMDLSMIFGSNEEIKPWEMLRKVDLEYTYTLDQFQEVINVWLSAAPNVEILSLDNSYLGIFPAISHLSKLKTLKLRGIGINDFEYWQLHNKQHLKVIAMGLTNNMEYVDGSELRKMAQITQETELVIDMKGLPDLRCDTKLCWLRKISNIKKVFNHNQNCKEYEVTENVDGTNLKIILSCAPCRGNTDGLRELPWSNVTLIDLKCDGELTGEANSGDSSILRNATDDNRDTCITVSNESVNRIDLTLTYAGWPTEQLQFTVFGTNMGCEEKMADGKLLVLQKPKMGQKCGPSKMCSLNSIAKHNDTEYCQFTCKCLFTDRCEVLFVFLEDNETEICEIDVSDEFQYRKLT